MAAGLEGRWPGRPLARKEVRDVTASQATVVVLTAVAAAIIFIFVPAIRLPVVFAELVVILAIALLRPEHETG